MLPSTPSPIPIPCYFMPLPIFIPHMSHTLCAPFGVLSYEVPEKWMLNVEY